MDVQEAEPGVDSSGSAATEVGPVLKLEMVEEVLSRLGRGEPVQRVAQAYGVDRKTIRAWRARGRYQPRQPRPRRSRLDPHATWLTDRAPEVDYNAAVLYRELVTHGGYTGSSQQVLRFVRPLRLAAQPARASVRFETPPGLRAQVDFGQRTVCIADVRHGPRVRLHAWLFAPRPRAGLSPRAAECRPRRSGTGLPAFLQGAGHAE